MRVCGRPKRQSRTSGLTGAGAARAARAPARRGRTRSPATEPAAKRSQRRGVIGASGGSGGASATGERPGVSLRPAIATANSPPNQSGAMRRTSMSVNPAAANHARYSSSSGKSIHASASRRASGWAGSTGPASIAMPPGRTTR